MLRDFFIESNNERIGFMSGFKWTRQYAINFDTYMQYWYGPPEIGHQVFRALHRQINGKILFCYEYYNCIRACICGLWYILCYCL